MKKRYQFISILRLLSFCFVVLYHMLVHLATEEWVPIEKVAPYYARANMHIATLGVALFFMISGASLMLSSLNHFDLKSFYKKRFKRLLIPFYIVYAGDLLYRIIESGGLQNAFVNPGVPAWRFIFTLLGLDQWVNAHGYATFTLGIGEWFLGCLIIYSILFPLFRWCMLKNKYVSIGVATLYYAVVILCYHSDITQIFTSTLTKVYEFILGMFLILILDKIKKYWLIVIVPFICYWVLVPRVLPVNIEVGICLLSTAVFILFSQLEDIFCKLNLKFVDTINTVSYELFLVHHILIYICLDKLSPYKECSWAIPCVILLEIVSMFVFAIIVNKITKKIAP